jgi:hypothetical protein
LLLVERLTKDLADDDPDKIAFRTPNSQMKADVHAMNQQMLLR